MLWESGLAWKVVGGEGGERVFRRLERASWR